MKKPDPNTPPKKHRDHNFAIPIKSVIAGAEVEADRFPSLDALTQLSFERWLKRAWDVYGEIPRRDMARAQNVFAFYYKRDVCTKMKAAVEQCSKTKKGKPE